jgi:hypothetical protein
MHINGNYSVGAAGTLQMEINGTTPTTQYDQVRVLGAGSTVTLAGTLDLIAAPALAAGSTFTIIDNTSFNPVSGTFAGLPQDAEFFDDGQWWRISYTGGTGNDVVLTRITPTPWRVWQLTNFGVNSNNPAVADFMVDVEPDGLVNLLEYALGGDPNSPSQTASPTSGITAGRLALTFNRVLANTDLTMTVEGADSLAGPWSDLASTVAGAPLTAVPGVSVLETGTGPNRSVEVRDLYLVTDPEHPRRFLRLNITRP